MIGYGTYQTLSGFTFGFAQGFPVSYFSALLGSVVCFVVSRLWLKGFVTRLMARYPNLKAVVHAVEKKGFKVTINHMIPQQTSIDNAFHSSFCLSDYLHIHSISW